MTLSRINKVVDHEWQKRYDDRMSKLVKLDRVISLFDTANLDYFVVKGGKGRSVTLEWTEKESGDLNWIDDQSQAPYTYRVQKKTDMALTVLSLFGIVMDECRFLDVRLSE